MQLNKKKELAARTLHVGKERILFNSQRLAEIKEAITKQDIKDLFQNRAIMIKEIKGRKRIEKRKRRRGFGSVKMKVSAGKQGYVKITRRLRKHIYELKKRGFLDSDNYWKIRSEIRQRAFADKSHLKERIDSISKNKKIKKSKIKPGRKK